MFGAYQSFIDMAKEREYEEQMRRLRDIASSRPDPITLGANMLKGTYIDNSLKIERAVYNNPATIVWFADGEKVVVKCHNEEFDKEKGVAMAIARKLMSRSEFVKIVGSGENQKQEPIMQFAHLRMKKDKGDED